MNCFVFNTELIVLWDKNLLLLFYMWIFSFPCTICQEKVFSDVYCWHTCQKSGLWLWELISVIIMYNGVVYSTPLIYISVSMPVPCCFSYHGLIILLEIRYGNQFSIILFAQDCFDYPWSLVCGF